ncbi:roadblock/LC7 domain-containing protein [Streptomyces sp. Tu 3180]|uniref:roadblock/LC7 domain-containing protein n=1 Tax=Streptomyces sp. Tu 3180 TaxID=2682611 RepID=UPI00135A7289|nr:roadblock/LC7 domain-containing protein [Streptomyces sp. Tu 3180]KAF3470063.1 roadblock/LC7 domain-containing protein [Streptomyces sp. Tu 3180]
MTNHNNKGNGNGWLLSELEKTAGVESAVLVSADGMLQAHTGELDIDHAEKLAAVAATLRGASRAYAQEAGGEGVRQVLIETVTHIALITQAGENTMLVVKTDGPNADMGVVSEAAHRLASRVGRELAVAARSTGSTKAPTA